MTLLPDPTTYLDIRNVEETIGRALLFHLSLAFQARTDYESIKALQSQPSRFQDDHGTGAPDLAQIGTDLYTWYCFDQRKEDGNEIIKPDDVNEKEAGRWIRQKLPHYVQCGLPSFFKWMELCDAQLSLEEMWNRSRSQTPALFLSCLGDTVENVSQTRAYHFYEFHYRLRVLSANFRGGLGARFGSPEETEKTQDPGTAKLLGWLRWYLISENRLGNTVGISEIELKERTADLSQAVDRVLSDYIDILVRGSIHTPNVPCDVIKPQNITIALKESLDETRKEEGEIKFLQKING